MRMHMTELFEVKAQALTYYIITKPITDVYTVEPLIKDTSL